MTVLVSSLPFSFTVDGPNQGIPLVAAPTGYPYGGFGQMVWAIDLRLENGSGDIEDVSVGEFITRLPGTEINDPDLVADDGPVIVSTYVSTILGATITWTTRFVCTDHDITGDTLWLLDGNIEVLVESDIPLTVHEMTPSYGGFSVGWTGNDNNVVAWDPLPRFSEDPGVDPEVELDPAIYDTASWFDPSSSNWYHEVHLLVSEGEDPPPPDPTPIEEDNKLSVWGFNQDGHKHYVLRLGDDITLVYDRSTGQWAEWRTEGETVWRPHLGLNWLGIGASPLGTHSWNVIGGDDRSGILWNIDPSYGLDHDATQTEVPYTRKVIGMFPQRIREGTQCGGVYVIGDLGDPAVTGDTITLQTSDDNGQSWTNHGAVTVTAANYNQEIAWIGLGLITNPGRLFLLEDDGAFARISSMDMR